MNEEFAEEEEYVLEGAASDEEDPTTRHLNKQKRADADVEEIDYSGLEEGLTPEKVIESSSDNQRGRDRETMKHRKHDHLNYSIN